MEKLDLAKIGCVKEGERKKPRPKEKRMEIACQDAKARIKNYNEVALGYSPEEAVVESMRCLE